MTDSPLARSCLLVEDSPMMRRLLRFALERVGGLEITEAEHGLEGLRALAGRRFDLIVTDLNMPIMDGLKLIRHARADGRHGETPILVVTTERGEVDRERAISLGANAYVTKPVQVDEILATARRLLGEATA